MSTVTVSPETFTMVEFDADEIRAIAEALASRVGFPDVPVEIRVDETVPLGRVRIASTDPVVIEIDGGALEDPKRIRKFYADGAARVIGRLLFQAKDLLDPAFGTPPDREDMSLELRAAWDTYGSGRVARLGYSSQRQRWVYSFRTRHGFSDEVDRSFDALWSGDGLSWAEIEQLSADATTSAAAPTA